jgi:hypothetical protein
MKDRCEGIAEVVMKSLRSHLRPDDIVIMSSHGHWKYAYSEMSALWGRVVGPDKVSKSGTKLRVVMSPDATLVVVGPPPPPTDKGSECASPKDQHHAAGQCDRPDTATVLTRRLMGDLFDLLE